MGPDADLERLPFQSRVLLGPAWVGWALASLTVCKTAAQAEAVQICPDPPPQASFWRGLRRAPAARVDGKRLSRHVRLSDLGLATQPGWQLHH